MSALKFSQIALGSTPSSTDYFVGVQGGANDVLYTGAQVKSLVLGGQTLTATAFSAAGQLPGTTTNDTANAGNVGQLITSTVLAGSAVSLTTNTAANVTSISLTAGDWDVSGNVTFVVTGSTSITFQGVWVSTTSATFPTLPNNGSYSSYVGPAILGLASTYSLSPLRVSVATTTTVYLSAESTFTASTSSVYGHIRARRIR